MTNLPLKGVRIVDIAHAWAGPHATRVLADFGAEVIRVEYIKRLCLLRGGKKENQAYNKQPGWFQINRNKYSITLDLKIERDRSILKDLVKISDVFIENARAGVMDKLGFSYQDLIRIRPDIIAVSMAGFGNSGPYASFAGYGATFEAMSGIQNLTAYDKKTKPYRIKEMDIINGIVAAGAIMTALLYRQRTGEGQHVDFSHMEASSHALMGEHLLEYVMNGTQTVPIGNRHPRFAPQGCYPCQGSDKWVTLTVRSDKEWQRFCDALCHHEWKTDKRFARLSARIKNHDELDRLIGEWTAKYTHYEVMQILQSYNIPSCAVLDVTEISSNPHLKEHTYFISGVESSDKLFMGMPFTLSKGAGKIQWRGPDLGQHNERILCELLGRSKDEVKPIKENEIGTAYDAE